MEWLTGITKLLEILVWPVFAGFTIYFFRLQIDTLSTNLSSAKFLGAEFAFRQAEAQAQVRVEAEKLIHAEGLPEEDRRKIAAQLRSAMDTVAALAEQRIDLLNQAGFPGLIHGRAELITDAVDFYGADKIAVISEESMIALWPVIYSQMQAKHPALMNRGSLVGLRNANVIDGNNQLTRLGAKLFQSIAKEKVLQAKLRDSSAD